MLINPRDQYHLGIVVDDFEATRDTFTTTMGYEWGADTSVELTLTTLEGTQTFPHRLQYSITEPRLELIQAREGTPFVASTSGLHHYGYWTDDVNTTTRDLEGIGWSWECGGGLDQSPVWAYLLNENGMRIEIVSRSIQATAQAMWSAA